MNGQVLLTDGLWRKTLASLRALSKSGLNVSVGERTPLSTSLFSKYAKKRHIYPSVSEKPHEFIEWLKNITGTGNYDVLITPEEETSLLVAGNRDILAPYIKIPLPDIKKLELARDKYKILLLGDKAGIPGTKVDLFKDFETLKKYKNDLLYPIVMKPRTGTGAKGLYYLYRPEDIKTLPDDLFSRYGEYITQEYIPGDEFYGVSVLFNHEGIMRSAFVHKKIRQYPVSGGVSTYAESVHRPDLVKLTEKLLKEIGWYGVANMEFKIDKRDNRPKLMELNPRLWGSLHLAIESGVNFPYLLYRLAMDGDIAPSFEYKEGVRFRWILQGDLMSFFSQMPRMNWDFFKFNRKNTSFAVLSLDDPLPAVGKLLSAVDYFTSKEMKKFHA